MVALRLNIISQVSAGELSVVHPSFRIISTASKSLPLKDWLLDEYANMFFPVPSQPMDQKEESHILALTGCSPDIVDTLISFADKYRQSMSADNILKNRKLGTRTLVRIARRLATFPQDDDLNAIISRSLLAEFLPAVERMNLETLLDESKIHKQTTLVCRHSALNYNSLTGYMIQFNPNLVIEKDYLLFSRSASNGQNGTQTRIPRFEASQDIKGVASHVPHMDHFYDNSLQTGMMRDLAIDLEILGEHVVLLGNQVCPPQPTGTRPILIWPSLLGCWEE